MTDHEFSDAAWRPKASRIDPRTPEVAAPAKWQAAGTGRTDALDPEAITDLQRLAGNRAVGGLLEQEPSPVHEVINSGGSALGAEVATEMSQRLGHDFSDVRVHTDSRAHDSAVAVNAQAYTVGNNVVFQRDKYDPASDSGKLMLAHELTHVVQQRSGPVDGTDAGGGIRVSDPDDRFEREAAANAESVMAQPVSAPAGGSSQNAHEGHDHSVQREAEDLDSEQDSAQVQTFVQREAEELEDEQVQTFVQREAPDDEELEAPA